MRDFIVLSVRTGRGHIFSMLSFVFYIIYRYFFINASFNQESEASSGLIWYS